MIKNVFIFIIVFVFSKCYSQNMLFLGINAGWRTNGPKCSYMFLNKFEAETLMEWHYYNSFGAGAFLNFYPIKNNINKQTGYIGLGYSNTFNTITGVEYKKDFYKYQISQIDYCIPKVGFSLNEIISKDNSILKAIALSLELQYAIPLKKSKIVMLDQKDEDIGLTNKIYNYYNRRNLGINVQLKFGFKK